MFYKFRIKKTYIIIIHNHHKKQQNKITDTFLYNNKN